MTRPSKPEQSIGVLAERQLPDGRRKINLRKNERRDLQRQQLIEAAVALFLDITVGRTWAEIAAELDISEQSLKDLTKSEEFETAYSAMFAELGHDPRYKATQGWLLDMLPTAMRQLNLLLTSPSTTPTTRLSAIKLILELTNIEVQAQTKDDDRKDMLKFLSESKTKIEIPPEFAEALRKFRPEAPVEAPIEGEYLSISEDAPV